jgi:hypothetical protein
VLADCRVPLARTSSPCSAIFARPPQITSRPPVTAGARAAMSTWLPDWCSPSVKCQRWLPAMMGAPTGSKGAAVSAPNYCRSMLCTLSRLQIQMCLQNMCDASGRCARRRLAFGRYRAGAAALQNGPAARAYSLVLRLVCSLWVDETARDCRLHGPDTALAQGLSCIVVHSFQNS